MNGKIISNDAIENFNAFKNIIKEVIHDISNLTNIEYINENKYFIESVNDINLFYEYILFKNYAKLISFNFDSNINENTENNFYFNGFNGVKIFNDKSSQNKDIYRIIFHFHIYLLYNIENAINSVEKESYLESEKIDINIYNHLLIQILSMIYKLYKERIYNFKNISIFLDSIIIFVKRRNNHSDKYINIKNIILFDLLFRKYFECLVPLIFNRKDDKKDDIILFLNYTINIINSKELNSYYNYEILSNNEIISKFISTLLNNFNYKENIIIFNNYKKKLIDSFANVYKNNTSNLNFFESLINHNKYSFINLVNYKTRKAEIINDIYTENFYIELLSKLFSNENNKNSIKNKHEENYFAFNGYNSKMTFKLEQINIGINSVIFFSFELHEKNIDTINNKSNALPLLYINSNSGKEIFLFKLYIEEQNKEYKLYIYQDKVGKKNKITTLDKLGNIEFNIKYIICLKFSNKKISFFMKKLDKKNAQFFEEIDTLECDYSSPVLRIGHDDEKNEYFKGYMGPILIVRNLIIKKNCKIEDIISNIFNLNNLYHFFPMFLSDTSFYNFDEKIIFSSNKEENEFNNIKTFLQNNILNIIFEFYLTPENLGVYHSLFMKNENEENFVFPEIPNVISDKKYKIIDINVSLVKHSSIYNDFIRNNGFDYFILIYEYIYQFLYIMNSNKIEFDLYNNNEELENIFINTINSALIILHQNYLYYKHYINNIKKFKTLFMNLYEILKLKNHKILDGISTELYDLNFDFIQELNELKVKIKNEPDNKYLTEEKNIISSFSNSLTEMIFDFELYKNNQQSNSITLLFLISNKILMEYKNSNNPNKIFPFEEGFFLELLNFINVFKNEFNSGSDNNCIIIIQNFFDLIKKYLEAIDNPKIKKDYFRQLFIIMKNNQNKYTLIINFLYIIYDILSEDFYLENEELEFLLNFLNIKKTEGKENNASNKLIDDMNIIICNILAKQIFIDNSKELLNTINSKLAGLKNFDILLSNIISELKKNFDYFLNIDKNFDDTELFGSIKYVDIYENIFNFILDLFNLIITNDGKFSLIINQDKISDRKENENFTKLFDLLNYINKTLNKTINKKVNIFSVFSIINYLKFYYRLIFWEKKVLLYSEIKFVENFIKVIELCNRYCLINSFTIFKLKIINYEYSKTIIEIIFDIFLEIFLTDESSIKCYDILLDKANFPFVDRQFIDNHKYSIFYVNDMLNYFLNKKKTKELDGDLIRKCNILSFYNNQLFIKQETFNGNLSTYFLLIIVNNYNKINDKEKFYNLPKSKLLDFLDELYNLILEEHISLYKTDKKYFFRTNLSNSYNELINFLKDKHARNKSNIEDTRKFIEVISEKVIKENQKSLNNIIKNDENIKENVEVNIIKSDLKDKEAIKMNYIKTNFFYDLDKYYATNIKKEIMNCIFSVYYLDEFFYSKDFCVVKKYYLNKHLNDLESFHSKKLNYPSTIKNYRNNFEPPLFIKKFNNYIVNPFFPLTHSYIENETLKKNLSMDKNIKLNKKDIKPFENDESIECEILKNEQGFFGKLYYNNSKGYLLFKEERSNFGDCSGYKYIFLISNMVENKKNIIERYYDRNVLILFDNVEEIIEMRILLLWKGFEIFLKNGKSYVFNFLTTNDYDNFMKNFILKSKIKNLVRKRSFISDKNLTQSWVKGLLSNFDYILLLNRYGSRSFHDTTQYPVFPWILNNYRHLQSFIGKERFYLKMKNEFLKQQEKSDIIEPINTSNNIIYETQDQNTSETTEKNSISEDLELKQKILSEKKMDYKSYKDFIKNEDNKNSVFIRDFRYPMTFQNENNRIAAKVKYEEEEINEKFPVHSGCHYSNSGFIYYYLMRQQPYGNLLVKLQEYKTENSNRCFMNITGLEDCLASGNDNRELIPEFFSKIEFFINLNCDFYGRLQIKNDHRLVDDCEMNEVIDNNKEKAYLSKYVSFILQHKKLMNSKLIGLHLNKWIDNIFGINQLPPEDSRKESYNIFSKYSYEQKMNLEKKLEKKKKKENLTENEIKFRINTTISYIVNLGVNPSILFHEAHPKLQLEIVDNNNNDQIKLHDKIDNDELNAFDDLEEEINESLTPKNLSFQIKGIPIYFKINPTINKIFIYIKDQDNLLILENELYNEISYKYFSFLKYNKIEKPNILFSKVNLVYQIKYGFSSFNKEINFDNVSGNYHTFFYNKMYYLLNNEKILDEYKDINFDKIIIITCRHIDFSFKIYYLEKDSNIKKKYNSKNKIYSYICEDFVTSCCCISSNAFIIGLNNGKLIYYIIKENPIIFNDKKKIEQSDNIIIEKDKYIQAHKGKINSIDIDKRLGIVITSGDDNYIFIRKLYDFELLLPIKIKNKFTILMTKVSSYNFLYVLCFNKVNFKNIIFGYTLSGMKFAKSEYGLYDNISINGEGHIITMNNKRELIILSGSDLTRLNNWDENNITKNIKEFKNVNWLQFDHFIRSKDDESNEIITFLKRKKDTSYIKTINMSNFLNDFC